MLSLSKLDRHERLVERMAEAQGVDIGEAMMRGELGANEFRGAVYRCTACTAADSCEHWLADHEDGAGVPEYCRNKAMMERLRDAG
jgi:hypothetical protein